MVTEPLAGVTRLAAAERGCLVLADISGYTAYLLASELEHAQDVLADLTQTIVKNLRPVLRLSKLEGDAAFAYVVDGEYAPSTVLDTVERVYFAFRSRLRDIAHATTCTCQACSLMPTLDLKFLVHHGSFVRRVVGRGEELIGGDVILAHRLLKNSAAEVIGTRGYALLTQACVDALGLDPAPLGLRPHVERYDDVGEVPCWLEHLDERWRFEQERRRVYVPAKGATSDLSFTFPAEPEVVWDWLTSPQRRTQWQADRVDEVTPGGRARAGAVSHCVHGPEVQVEEIADWRPFRYYTMRYPFPGVGQMLWTYELDPVDGGTRLSLRGERLTGRRRAAWQDLGPVLLEVMGGMMERLAAQLAASSD